MVLVIWLNENVHIHARFLAMPKLMQAWFWSSGLTKTFFIFRLSGFSANPRGYAGDPVESIQKKSR